jgi:hypothetical protein
MLWQFGIFHEHLECFMTTSYILCSFGTFFRFWYLSPRQIWQPWIRVPAKAYLGGVPRMGKSVI